jgi:ornithine cyclodeaminase
MHSGEFPTYSSAQVERWLDFGHCTEAVREAMAALSASTVEQPLRNVLQFGPGRMFGLMPGLMPIGDDFGIKVVSVVEDPARPGRAPHQGVVVLFDGKSGAVRCVAEAGSVTEIRTACATAVATDALARQNAKVLAIFGTGTQARSHLRAVSRVRPFERVLIWGRSADNAQRLVRDMADLVRCPIEVVLDGRAAAQRADVICTVTAASQPVLLGQWVRAGTHVNLVGSSIPGPVETDSELVKKSRYIADYKRSALAAAAEFLVAKRAGLVDDSHIVGEIGQVLLGKLAGREHAEQITLYKSLGHIVQDLAAVNVVHRRATRSASV